MNASESKIVGWVDHFDYYGPLEDPSILEEPKYLTASVILSQSEAGFQHAVRGWSRFGTPEVVEAVYAYVIQMRRGVLDRWGLLQKLLNLLPRATVGDILALQRVLKLGLGITTCDLGLVVLSYVQVAGGPPPRRPPTALFELRESDAVLYVTRNNSGAGVYDGETMCVLPMSEVEPRHPLYEAYTAGFRIYTEGFPSQGDLCVVHRKLGLRCRELA
ncbi:hypothetical protein [Pyrobaculum neutrophilum]|uniref:Uncharacterized protein n=1 Tax=Pyrobaculum neutrophilum (strain DSM 2338 / JCM 9278 / NBRC 100436 / V24Sta) TaxID=444157 RepID=B1Y9I7_PYRNV|nr:hypothetical protein [Pyrobaculum neutrophilum]ACB40416.1 conserved hypothetical protein [Pyrobaculum neutrophilum V24Sta]